MASTPSDASAEREELLKRRISALEAEVRSLRSEGAPKSRRTRLVTMNGEPCDYVEMLPSKITVKELRVKLANLQKVKLWRVQIFRSGARHEPLADEEEVHHEVLESSQESSLSYCSTGEPLLLVLGKEARVTYSGLVKCTLYHSDELLKGPGEARQRETWDSQWVTLSMEERDIGLDENDQLRIFVGDVDLVRFGKLKHTREFDRWANKVAGDLQLRVCEGLSAPRPADTPGRFSVAVGSGRPLPVAGAPSPFGPLLGQLADGEAFEVLEVTQFMTMVLGRIAFNGTEGWVQLTDTSTGEVMARSCDEEKLYKVELRRDYMVHGLAAEDLSQIWFVEEQERSAFVAAYHSWERNNPLPPRF